MGEDLTPEARDAAIIGSVQKIGHYKIAGYGTVKAYAKELKMDFAVAELARCLDNEYNSDQSFTQLAVGSVNAQAENAAINEDDQKQALKDDLNLLGNSVSIMNSSDSEDE
jgi:ferritin-like metal-binding protein YciE